MNNIEVGGGSILRATTAEPSGSYNYFKLKFVNAEGTEIFSPSDTNAGYLACTYNDKVYVCTYHVAYNCYNVDINQSSSVEITVVCNFPGYQSKEISVITYLNREVADNEITVTLYEDTISGHIARIKRAKADIKTAIENKGVNVGDGLIETYADKITSSLYGTHRILVDFHGSNTSTLNILSVSSDGSTFTGLTSNSTSSNGRRYYDIPYGTTHIKINSVDPSPSHPWYCYLWALDLFHKNDIGFQMDYTSEIETIGSASSSSKDGETCIYEITDLSDIYAIEVSYPCLISGTLITLSDFSQKPVEDITFDDEILVWDFYHGCFSTAKPMFIKKEETAPEYNLCTFSDGSQVGFVGSGGDKGYHRIFNKDKGSFTYTGNPDTPIGTATFNSLKETPTLVKQEIIYEPVEFYNVITDKHYNLFANGILTSMHWSNQYDIDPDTMMYAMDKRNITDETIIEETENMKSNPIWQYKNI